MDIIRFSEGEALLTKKPHACGGDRWRVIRAGADVKIKCETCGRVVMLGAEELQKRVKKRIKAEI
jgi:hypothetical protein